MVNQRGIEMKTYDDLTKKEQDRYMAYLMQRMSMDLYSYLFFLVSLGVSLLGLLLVSTLTVWGILAGLGFIGLSAIMFVLGYSQKMKDDKSLMLIFNMDRVGFFGVRNEDLNKLRRKVTWVKENGKANK